MDTLEGLLAWKGAVVAAWLLAFFMAERRRAFARLPSSLARAGARLHRLARNLSLAGINIALSPLIVVPLSAYAAGHALQWRPEWWTGWPGLALDLLLLDFLIYWWHRANHEIPFLWRFHEVHHLDRILDSTTAVRFHAGEVILSALFRAAVIVLLGFPIASVLVFEALVLIAAIFHHSNLRLPAGFERRLSRLVITPSLHWVHHHAVRRDTDSTYGTVFSFWDRLFGSTTATKRTATLPIGVEGQAELTLPALLIRPFRARETRRPAPRPSQP